MTTEAQKRATAKYHKKAYDQLKINVRKGWRDKVKQAADDAKESMTQYIVKATEARMGQE